MRYMLLIYSQESAWGRMTPEQREQATAGFMAYNEALKAAGAWIDGDQLQPTAAATTLRMGPEGAQVLDGPYAETKEQLGGYYLIEAESLDKALDWAARCPAAHYGAIELRPALGINAKAPA